MGLAIVLTIEFDYWDQYAEVNAILAILSGNTPLIIATAIMWGLSKETSLSLLLVAITTWSIAPLAGVVALAATKQIQGKARLYCERRTFWAYNIPDLKAAWSRKDPFPYIAVAWSIAAMSSLLWTPIMPEAMQRTAWMVPMYVVAAWQLARVREIRVLLPTAIWMIGAWAGA